MTIYKVLIETKYVSERIVRADSAKQVWDGMDRIIKSIDLMDDVPEVNTHVYTWKRMEKKDIDIDLTKTEETK